MPNILFDPTIEGLARTLTLHQQRHAVLASNLANVETPGYRARELDFQDALRQAFEETGAGAGEHVEGRAPIELESTGRAPLVVEDHAPPRMVFDPSHPDANADGYVAYPNVDAMSETIDLMAATRAYEANVQVVNATRQMAQAALGIGG